MVLNKSLRVLRRWRPTRSVLLDSKTFNDEALLFESGSLAILSKYQVTYYYSLKRPNFQVPEKWI